MDAVPLPDCTLRPEWLFPEKQFVHPRWGLIYPWVETFDEAWRDQIWCAVAQDWLLRVAAQFGDDYRVFASEHFFIVGSATKDRGTQVAHRCESIFARVRQVLGPLALPKWYAKFAVLLAPDLDTMLGYLSDFQTDGEHMLPGGVYLNRGYGHVLMQDGGDAFSGNVLAHELCHGLLIHLPLPAWLNEAVTMRVEHVVNGTTPSAFGGDREKLLAHWTPERIGAFWSGRSFDASDDGSHLSYALAAEILGAFAVRNARKIPEVVLRAKHDDSAFTAFREIYGETPADVLARILGPGDWARGHIISKPVPLPKPGSKAWFCAVP